MRKNIIKEIKDYIRRAKKWKKKIHGTKFNKENNITIKFIVPLLRILNWDPLYDRVEFQYHVHGKTKKGKHVDVALYKRKSEIPIILIEVKPMQHLKLEKADSQLFRSYLTNCKTPYGVTTNGIELRLFSKRFVKKSSGRARELFTLKLADFLVHRDVLRVLSREFVESGKLDKLSKAMQSEYYADWKKRLKTGEPKHDYELPFKFIKEFCKKLFKREN